MSKNGPIPVHPMDDNFSGFHMELVIINKSMTASYEISQPHRHDYYYCILLEKGEIELGVDFEKVKITAQSLYLSYPGQVHQVYSARIEQGWVLYFDHTVLSEDLRSILDQFLSEVMLLKLSSEQSADFFNLLRILNNFYIRKDALFRQNLIQSQFTTFLYLMTSAYLSREKYNMSTNPIRSIEITKTFMEILRRNFKSIKKPSEFAAKMNLTAGYLNDTIKAITGFPVTYYIHKELILEAQRLLCYSNLTVSEIADVLGFHDAKYFSRLFNKVTGLSPGAFRKKKVGEV